MKTPPKAEDLQTESDVEQKFAWPLLTSLRPNGLGFPEAEVFTKPNIREFQIGKGPSSKRYYPDHVVTALGLPVVLLEAKRPGEDLSAAAGECRLYATELNIREEDIFERQIETGQVGGLPHGVVAKVLLRTNRRYYDGDHSFVKNLFQSDPAAPKPCAFLRYWILAWLRASGGIVGPSGVKGYHRQGDLIRDLLAIGADPESVRVECRYLAKAGCLLAEHLRADSITDADLISLTPAGHVHLELAHRDINYLSACAEDAWVATRTVAEGVRRRITQQPYWRGLSWQNTKANAADFCAYLKSAQDASIQAAPYLPSSPRFADTVDFQKILDEIANHQTRAATFQAAPPDLNLLHDQPPADADETRSAP